MKDYAIEVKVYFDVHVRAETSVEAEMIAKRAVSGSASYIDKDDEVVNAEEGYMTISKNEEIL